VEETGIEALACACILLCLHLSCLHHKFWCRHCLSAIAWIGQL